MFQDKVHFCCYKNEQIRDCASMRDGFDFYTEAKYRREGAMFSIETGGELMYTSPSKLKPEMIAKGALCSAVKNLIFKIRRKGNQILQSCRRNMRTTFKDKNECFGGLLGILQLMYTSPLKLKPEKKAALCLAAKILIFNIRRIESQILRNGVMILSQKEGDT
ncbi:hypothetical protein WA026_009289 [Henosepilachna vigintioctopunctata]|uniref:Uncharacterized protein n=1 Tax=Henosepilachna vigintioctopunctata TaxID=420089 RepID=A0AAW1UW54_9CUCU